MKSSHGKPFAEGVEELFFLPNGGFIARDRNNECKELNFWHGVFTIKSTHKGDPSVGCLALLPDSRYFVTQVSPGMMHLWDGRDVSSILQCNGKIERVIVNNTGKKLVVILENGAIMPWFYKSRAFIGERFLPGAKYVDATFTHNDSIVAATDQNTLVTLSLTFEPVEEAIRPDGGSLLSLDYDHEQKRLLVTTSLGVYAYDQQGIQTKLFSPSNLRRNVEKTIFSPDKKFFWIRLKGRDAYKVRDATTGECICAGKGLSDYQWSPQGKYLFAVEDGSTVNIRTVPDFNLYQYFLNSADITTAALTDGKQQDRLLATGHSDGSIRIYSLPPFVPTSTPKNMDSKIIFISGNINSQEIPRDKLVKKLQVGRDSEIIILCSL